VCSSPTSPGALDALVALAGPDADTPLLSRVWRADHDYYNFVETPAEAHVAFPRASYQRLRELKARYDPTR
jgi:hypothetical protein